MHQINKMSTPSMYEYWLVKGLKLQLGDKDKIKSETNWYFFLLHILTDSVIRITAWTVRPYISSPLTCSVNSFNMDESSRILATCWTTCSQIPKGELTAKGQELF